VSAAAVFRSHACIRAHASAAASRADVGRNGQPPARGRLRLVASRAPAALGFDQAILPHLDAAYNLARWMMRDPSDAEDVVQDACLRALQYFSACRSGNEKAWLLQIVRNTAYTKLRNRRRVEVALETGDDGSGFAGMMIADPAPGPEAAVAAAQDLALLRTMMEALPVDLRECLILRELEELSYKEIAGVTGAPLGTVMSRLHRARRMLAASWSEDAFTPAQPAR